MRSTAGSAAASRSTGETDSRSGTRARPPARDRRAGTASVSTVSCAATAGCAARADMATMTSDGPNLATPTTHR